MMVNKKIVTVGIVCNLLLWGSIPFSVGQAASISKDEKAKIKEEIAEQVKYVEEYRARERKLEAERKAKEEAERKAREAVFMQKYNALLPVLQRCGIVYGERELLNTINKDLAGNRSHVNDNGSYNKPEVDFMIRAGMDTHMIGVIWEGRKFFALRGKGNHYVVLGSVIMRRDGLFEIYLPENRGCLVYDWNQLRYFARGGFILEYSNDWNWPDRMQEIANAIAEYDS